MIELTTEQVKEICDKYTNSKMDMIKMLRRHIPMGLKEAHAIITKYPTINELKEFLLQLVPESGRVNFCPFCKQEIKNV